MRLFIAVTFSEEILRTLKEISSALRVGGTKGQYVPAENMHLTLAFLGECGEESIDEIKAAMDMAGIKYAQLEENGPAGIRLDGCGNFGTLFWIGMDTGKALPACVDVLRGELARRKIWFDRKPFKPHITLIRNAKGLPGRDSIEVPPTFMTAEKISLMRSDRIDGKMKYTEIYSSAI